MNNDTINVDISKKWQLLLWKVFLSAAITFMVVEVIICLVKKIWEWRGERIWGYM